MLDNFRVWSNEHSSRTCTITQASRSRDYVFILEDLELAFPVEQLELITNQWNAGMELEDIAKWHKRKPEEVFLALFHQAMENKVTRAFAYRRRGG